MSSDYRKRFVISRLFREFIIEASEEQLVESLAGLGIEFKTLVDQGEQVAQAALADGGIDNVGLEDLHRGLGALVRMLRRRSSLSAPELAARAAIDVTELERIESDPTFEANPRTIFQLEQHFRLAPRTLVLLSGSVRVDDTVRAEAVRFAAMAESAATLTREERKLLNAFVRVLKDHTEG